MKRIMVLLCVILVGCGPKSNESKVKDLITAYLKTSLPDIEAYKSLNFGTLGTATLTYEETDQFKTNIKVLQNWKDSTTLVEKSITENKGLLPSAEIKAKFQKLQDSTSSKIESNKLAKQGYTPEKLYKLTHAYTLRDKNDNDIKHEDAFFIDEALTKVVKVKKIF